MGDAFEGLPSVYHAAVILPPDGRHGFLDVINEALMTAARLVLGRKECPTAGIIRQLKRKDD